MAVIINSEIKREILPPKIDSLLPYRLSDEIKKIGGRLGRIEEIRLRTEKVASLTVDGRNVILKTMLSKEEMELFLSKICDNSLYAHSETINKGYITLDGGIRVGICGRASVEGQKVFGVYNISAMNIRIPRAIRNVGEPVCRLLRELCGVSGVLIYSPPGEGKTTLLRAVAEKMSSGENPLRVAIIDTRGELGFSLAKKELCVDILSGYPRGIGIEIATRTMNSQLIVCDEVGDVKEAEAIISAQNSGVPFLASAHSDSIEALMRRTGIRHLHRAHIFGAYVGISKRNGDFVYKITDWEEADDILQNSRGDTHTRSGNSGQPLAQ